MINTVSLRQFLQLWNADNGQGIRDLFKSISINSLRPALQDADYDDIPDGIEALLLLKFRPYYLFSTNKGNDEHYLPTYYNDYLRRCGLINRMDSGDVEFAVYGAFANDPSQILSVNCAPDGTCTTDLTTFHDRSNYRLQVDPSFYQGFDDGRDLASHWNDIVSIGNVGLYGHVVPDQNGNYKIGYWQFYAYNNADEPLTIMIMSVIWNCPFTGQHGLQTLNYRKPDVAFSLELPPKVVLFINVSPC